MSEYVRRTWNDGDVITAVGLNNIEEGIAEALREADDAALKVDEAKAAAEAAQTAAENVTPGNIGAVKKTGDTMTGNLNINKAYRPAITFNLADGQKLGGIWADNTNGRTFVEAYPLDSDAYREQFLFPIPDSGLTATKNYSVLTSKTPVTIEQGGSNAATRKEAASNFLSMGSNPISSPSQDTPTNWNNLGIGIAKFNGSGKLTDQPAPYGFVLNWVINGEIVQFWLSLSTTPCMAIRTGTVSAGWHTSWKKVTLT